ncbi:S8 family peptidase [Halalkalibacterium halodurans]|uniref:S8 family peptidase n=2 Tax=Halalkalibacterium halodurans TaxID=86665 RepID=UPI002E1F25AB|nr:S8 family peptidase [Halalkalibacterium halodurans]
MKTMKTLVIVIGVLALLFIVAIGHVRDQDQALIQTKEIPKTLETEAMDHLLAEDLSLTTSMFIKQMAEQLQRWSEQLEEDPTIKDEFRQQIDEHPHMQGFAIAEANKITQKVGTLHRDDVKALTHVHHNQRYSDPYNVDDSTYMLIGETTDDGRLLIGELNLEFVKKYVKDIAAVADTNGNFFIGGDNPDVSWQDQDERATQLTSETVPELGWDIHVQSEGQEEEGPAYHEHQAVIRFKPNRDPAAWFATNPYRVVEEAPPFFVIESPNQTTVEIVEALSRDYDLDFAEPNYRFTKQIQTPVTPNDEFFKEYQWNLQQIDIEEGWSLASGENVKIAILDTGVDPNHPDIKDKIVNGYNAVEGNNNFADKHGHGTHVAGVAAAVTNNVTGIAGISWKSEILPVKVLNDNGEGSSFEVAKGIYWATDHGAKVINMSLGDYYHSDALRDAVKYAYDHDVVLIAASGNDNVEDPLYPAIYEEVLTVAAVDDTRNRAFFSNFGKHIDVTAPGEHIPSLFPDNQYTVMSGTSMASPHAAGLAGLIRSLRPDLSNQEVMDIMKETAKDLGPKGHDVYYGHGEIDIEAALKAIRTS